MNKDCNIEQSSKNGYERSYSSLPSSNETVILERQSSSNQNAYRMNNYPQRNYYSDPNCQTPTERDYDYSFPQIENYNQFESFQHFEPFQQYCQDEFPYPFSTPRFQNLECQGYETHSAYPIQFYPRGYKDRHGRMPYPFQPPCNNKCVPIESFSINNIQKKQNVPYHEFPMVSPVSKRYPTSSNQYSYPPSSKDKQKANIGLIPKAKTNENGKNFNNHTDTDSSMSSKPSNISTNQKIPYICRDYRRGYCTRGCNCRFMHVLDAKGNSDTIEEESTQVCRDFLRGQCYRKNCKFLHCFPAVATTTSDHDSSQQ